MKRPLIRSQGVIASESVSGPSRTENTWDRFESLYRSCRDDLYSYVAALLRDRVIALAALLPAGLLLGLLLWIGSFVRQRRREQVLDLL